MFLLPSLTMMSIAATRMYRSLADFLSSTEVYAALSFHRISSLIQCGQRLRSVTDSDLTPRKGRVFPNRKSTFTAPTLPNPVEVHTARENYPSSMTSESVVYIDRDHPGQPQRNKPDSLCFDDDAEKGVQK